MSVMLSHTLVWLLTSLEAIPTVLLLLCTVSCYIECVAHLTHTQAYTYTHKHNIMSVIHTLIVQPTISLDILNYTHFIDGTARLPCPVSSNPPSTFQWRLGENMTELQGPRYQVDSIDGTLTITQLRIPDTNTYHCVATNYLGSDTAATTITVEGMYTCM